MSEAIYVRESDKPASLRTIQDVSRTAAAGYAGIKGAFSQLFRIVWQNPYGLTPQQVLDLHGADNADKTNLSAAKLFAISNAYVGLVNLLGEGITTVIPAGVTVTINADGTVTLGQS